MTSRDGEKRESEGKEGEESQGAESYRRPTPPEGRVASAFRAWLAALATDPEAATAAAMAYESLAPEGRSAWLDAIATEAEVLDVPALALYAPLLGVENDPGRRARIEGALAAAPATPHLPRTLRALYGEHPSGESVAAIVVPLYLDFVEILVCRYHPDKGVSSARRGPLLRSTEVWSGPTRVAQVDGVELVEEPFAFVVEGLAHALVADRREGRPPPEPLRTYDFLFTLDLDPDETLARVRAVRTS